MGVGITSGSSIRDDLGGADAPLPARPPEHCQECTITLGSKTLLHARPAAMIVKITNYFLDPERGETAFVSRGGETVPAQGAFGLLLLAAGPGSNLHFKVTAPEAKVSLYLENLRRLLATSEAPEVTIRDPIKGPAMGFHPPELLEILRASVAEVGERRYQG